MSHISGEDDHVYHLQPSEDRDPRNPGHRDPPDQDALFDLQHFNADKEFKDTAVGRFEPYENWNDFQDLVQVSKVDGKVIIWKDPQAFVDRCEI